MKLQQRSDFLLSTRLSIVAGTLLMHALPDAEKRQHRLRDCEACKRYYSDLATLFPANGSNSKASTGQDENTVTIYTGKDATLKQVGKQIINSLRAVSLNIGLRATTSLHGKPNNRLVK